MPLEWSFIEQGLLQGRPQTIQRRDPPDGNGLRHMVAFFDLDDTLIKTKSGSLFAQDDKDWVWWNHTVPEMLKKTHDSGHHIVIITNQGRLTTTKGDESPEAHSFKAKLDDISEELDIPLLVYAACANDMWRKPRTGVWDKMQKDFTREGIMIHWDQAFLVGDAAGRPKDHSDADWHFCLNTGIEFYTPEEFFLTAAPERRGHKFDPSLYICSPTSNVTRHISKILSQTAPLLIVLVGLPGSGKTHVFKQHLRNNNVTYISPRTSAGALSQQEEAKNHLLEKRNVVVDDCHTRRSERAPWIAVGKTCSSKTIAIHLLSPLDLCIHNDAVRAFGDYSNPGTNRPVTPRNPFKLLAKDFETPTTKEGFDQIMELNFEWSGTSEELLEWNKHWI